MLAMRGFALRCLVVLLGVDLVAARAPRADEPRPAVARPSLGVGKNHRAAGTAFFVAVPNAPGAAAVTTAHGFALEDLFAASEVQFELARTQRLVARSKALLAPPGRPFQQAGGSVRDDFLVFALDEPPSHVRLLLLDERALPAIGERVQILGIPQGVPHDEDDVFGEVAALSRDSIDVDLDAPADLRGWGGAPVLAYETKRVVGIVQAAQKAGATLRLTVSPVDGLRAAMAAPLDGGAGRALASFAGSAAAAPTLASSEAPAARAVRSTVPPPRASKRPPTSSTGTRDKNRSATAETSQGTAPVSAKTPSAAGASPEEVTPGVGPAGTSQEGIPVRASGEMLIPRDFSDPTRLELTIDTPAQGARFGESVGAFVAGRALGVSGEMRQFDVILVLDTSGSTISPTGTDINGNGTVGKAPIGVVGALVGLGNTDKGDSILAAEVLAARRLLSRLDSRNTRVGLVTFAGDPPEKGGALFSGGPRSPAITEEPLTREYRKIEQSLERVLERGPDGMTHIAAGLDQATTELLGLDGGQSKKNAESGKFVLFMTDGQPTLPSPNTNENVRAVLRAVERARRAGIRVHSFGIGPEALEGPIAVVEMARRTHGSFTPVRSPADIVDVMEKVRFVDVQTVDVRNLTTGMASDASFASADGSFGALVPLAPGENRIEVVARASDGTTATEILVVREEPGQTSPPLPKELVLQRNRLLEQKLIALKRDRIEAERAATAEQRKTLEVEIEKERSQAETRAAEQREQIDRGAATAP